VKQVVVLFLIVMVALSGCATPIERYLENNTDVPDEVVSAMSYGGLVQGMTKEETLLTIGEPWKTHGYTTEDGLVELWVYSEFSWHEYENVVFREGEIAGWNMPTTVKKELDTNAHEQTLTEEYTSSV